MVKKANKSGEYRSFKIEGSSIGYEGSAFVSATPGGAAKKAARKMYKLIQNDSSFSRYKSDKLVQIIIRETTLGSKNGLFAYDAYKEKLAQPVERKLPNGSMYVVEYVYKTKALGENDVSSSLRRKCYKNVQ